VILWLYHTTELTLKKTHTQTPSVVARSGVYFAEKAPTSKKSPFYSRARSSANLRSAWLLQAAFPDLGFLVWTITIKVWQNTEPTESNYWFSSTVYSITLRPMSSIKIRKAIIGLRWSNQFP